MIELYSPQNEIELAIIKSIFNAERINYFVRNDKFGSLKIGPQIYLYNEKMIIVQENQFDDAKELLTDYLSKTQIDIRNSRSQHSLLDKIRMVFEVLLFGWFIPDNSYWLRKVKDD